MKGKGKGERKDDRLDKDCPLQFPDLKPVDHTRMCPRYTQVLARREEDGIGLEDMDTLQTEMETLLASVAKRMRVLEGEISILNNWQEKGKDSKDGTPQIAKKGGKEKRSGKGSEERPSKKQKTETPTKSSNSISGKPKGKAQLLKPQEFELPESPSRPPELPRIPKNETPNRFWSMVEPYCADISNDDLKVLEDILQTHEEEADFFKIPSLGKHYAEKWAQEDMIEEQNEGFRIGKSKNEKRRSSSTSSAEATALLKRLDENESEESPFGPLTQRLVSALIEENIMAPLEDSSSLEIDAAEAANMSPRTLAKHLNIGNPVQLEKRIRKELEEQGILDCDDPSEDDPEDEILMELRKKQAELRALGQQNVLVTKKLMKLAREEIQRQEIRKKLAAADSEVMEAYRKVQLIRQRRKALTKKEKDAALKVIRERENIVGQLEEF